MPIGALSPCVIVAMTLPFALYEAHEPVDEQA
jgi:hypothetical protein